MLFNAEKKGKEENWVRMAIDLGLKMMVIFLFLGGFVNSRSETKFKFFEYKRKYFYPPDGAFTHSIRGCP